MLGMSPTFWRGKRVLLTGHTGFKGSWLALWLHSAGAELTGISLLPETTPNLFSLIGIEKICRSYFVDIRAADELDDVIKRARPEVVFHLAAQPLVLRSYQQPVETFATNVLGTAHVLNALVGLDSVRVAVMVTTDKVYLNNEWSWPYRESDVLGGHDPYSASKAASENVIDCYRQSFLSAQGVAIASARAGNVIGGGDWSRNRLIPDAVRAWQSNQTLEIRRPNAIRPWQHVLEPLCGYIQLAEKLWDQPALSGAYNFGPETNDVATVQDVVQLMRKAYGKGDVHFESGSKGHHEAGCLALEITKAKTMLDVKPRWTLAEAVTRTMHWYAAQHRGVDASELCKLDIAAFEALP
jgi:CDP-glucose 4,6-dehydratase